MFTHERTSLQSNVYKSVNKQPSQEVKQDVLSLEARDLMETQNGKALFY